MGNWISVFDVTFFCGLLLFILSLIYLVWCELKERRLRRHPELWLSEPVPLHLPDDNIYFSLINWLQSFVLRVNYQKRSVIGMAIGFAIMALRVALEYQ